MKMSFKYFVKSNKNFAIICFYIISMIIFISPIKSHAYDTESFRYLSDIDYIKDQSSVGWGSILLDRNVESNINNGLITLNIEGKKTPFLKGVLAHATSTLVYDLSSYNYDYFTAYIGLDESKGNSGNGIKFTIYTSTDGTTWKTETQTPVLKGTSNAVFVKINIKNVKYLKLYCHNNNNDTADHAVYANAKLIKENYVEDTTPVSFIKTLDEYDRVIKSKSLDKQLQENELVILQRKFVKSMGYDILQAYAKYSDENKSALEWIMTNKDVLRYYITGGTPSGSYINSLKVLVKLYNTYKDDLNNSTITKNGVKLGDLYTRMMITLSLTHSANVCAWYGGNQCSDPITRYAIYKRLQSQDLLENKVFETLTVEEMRWVMNNQIADEEIEWLNAWARKFPVTSGTRKAPYNREPYIYIRYTFGYNYGRDQYYSQENYAKWNEKYNLSAYNITYEKGKPKIWIVFEEGGVCGATSKLGSNLNAVFGYPTAVIGQPGHAAYLEYFSNDKGEGTWGIQNNISGWTKSEKGERLLAGWGSNNWDSYYQVSYVPYGQTAQNDIVNFNKAEEILLLVDSYTNDFTKLESIYREAIKIQSINMDAWYGLIQLYKSNDSKTEQDYYKLAEDLTNALKFYPLPMWDLLRQFNTKFESAEYKVKYTLLEKTALERAKIASNGDGLLQPDITKTMANYLLGNNDYSIATFSFDGDNAGKIVLSNKFQGTTVNYEYSLDGKNTWTQTQESVKQLTKEEIAKINAENDINIHLVGADQNDIYTIDIREQNAPSNLYNNDLENKVIGATDIMEWRMKGSNTWTSFKNSKPDLTGNKTVIVRIAKTGIYMESKEVTLNYTEDIVDKTKEYVPISHLSIHGFSTEASGQGRYVTNAIDGNYYTNWHSAWNGTDTQRFITIKVDKPIYLSAVDYVPGGGGNGKILDGTIYGSMDGTNWKVLKKVTNLANNETTKTIKIDKPSKIQYVKIVADRASNGNWMVARMFNLYQDTTEKKAPTAQISYSTTNKTTNNVVVKLINHSTNIKITNNNGSDTYTFKENGTFTFEFEDETGTKGMTTAKVDWIVKNENNQNTGNDKPQNKPNNNSSTSTNNSTTIINGNSNVTNNPNKEDNNVNTNTEPTTPNDIKENNNSNISTDKEDTQKEDKKDNSSKNENAKKEINKKTSPFKIILIITISLAVIVVGYIVAKKYNKY